MRQSPIGMQLKGVLPVENDGAAYLLSKDLNEDNVRVTNNKDKQLMNLV